MEGDGIKKKKEMKTGESTLKSAEGAELERVEA